MRMITNAFLKDQLVFAELIPAELEVVSKCMFVQDVAKGDVLFEEGSHANYMCLVMDGTLEVVKRLNDGSPTVIATLTEGSSVGEMSMVDGMVRSATVRAAYPSAIAVLKKKEFDKLLQEYPRIGTKMLKGISRLISMNLRKTSNELTALMMPVT